MARAAGVGGGVKRCALSQHTPFHHFCAAAAAAAAAAAVAPRVIPF